MKRTKKILIGVLSAICAVSMLFAFACSGKTINSVSQKTVYNVGTSIDLFDLFETEDGYTYAFKVGEKGNKDATPVNGRYYYADKAGEFTAYLEGVKGGEKQNGTAQFVVSDTLPYMIVDNNSVRMNYNSYINIDKLINSVGIFMSSDTNVEYSIDKVTFYKNHYVSEGEEIAITKGTPSGNGFYDGDVRLTFNNEGVYEFHLLATNAGGTADGTFKVSVSENTSTYINLGELNYDETTRVASWQAVDGASYYRVKIDYENVITAETSIDIDDYLIPEANGFQDFDLVVIPLGENKKELKFEDSEGYDVNGMFIQEDVIIAPEGFGRIVLGESARVDAETGTATLIGSTATLSLSTEGLMAMNSGYLGWQGDYGLNTYVEFEFTGNNIPNVIFFADEINNELTYGGKTIDSEKNKGLMIISGIYGAYSGSTNMLACGDTVAIFGPNRYENGWSILDRRWCSKSGVPAPTYVGNGYKNPIPSDYALLTQDGLKNDTTGRTYKYVVGTYGVEANGKTKIYLEMRLYDVANPLEPLFVVQQDTKLTTDQFIFDGNEFKGGNIIVIAPSKEESSISQIKVSKPFTSQPLNVLKKNMTENADGSYTLKGANPPNANSASFRLSQEGASTMTGFRAYTGENEVGYGLGTYLDITFKGNNLPILTFFADQTSGGIAEGCEVGQVGAGMLMINGLRNKNDDSETAGDNYSPSYANQLRIYGPFKYGAKDDATNKYIYNREGTKYFTSSADVSYLSALAQDNLDENTDYRLIVGVIEKRGNLYWDMQFVNVTTNTVIFEKNVLTTVTVEAMKEALGLGTTDELKGYIVVSGAFKGVDAEGNPLDTTCKVTLSEGVRPTSGLPRPSNYPEEVTLKGAYNNNRNTGNYYEQNPTWLTGSKTLLDNDDFPANYGLNTFVDISFTGNNMPIMTFFAKENSAGIANGVATTATGAGIILLNGLVHKEGTNLVDRFRIVGPYKYGAKNSAGTAYIYNQDNIVNAGTYSQVYKTGEHVLGALAQNNLVADNDYRLIVGTTTKDDGYIYFDIQFKNITTNTILVDTEVKSTVTVEAMKTAMALDATDDLAGYIIFNGAYKGIDASSNPLSTTFTINAVQTGKITMPTQA